MNIGGKKLDRLQALRYTIIGGKVIYSIQYKNSSKTETKDFNLDFQAARFGRQNKQIEKITRTHYDDSGKVVIYQDPPEEEIKCDYI